MSSKFEKLRAMLMPKAPDASDEDIRGRTEAIAQGPFGFGDEIGAGLQALAAAGGKHESPMAAAKAGEDTYKQARFENRDILRKEQEKEPVRAHALEFAASAPLMAAGAPAKAAGLAAKDIGFASKLASSPLSAGVKEAMIAAVPTGAISGLGHSIEKDPLGMAADTAFTAGTAGLGAGVLRGGVNAALRNKAIKALISKMQTKAISNRTGGMAHDPALDATPHDPMAEAMQNARLAKGKAQLDANRSLPPRDYDVDLESGDLKPLYGNATSAGGSDRLQALLEALRKD